MPVEYSPTPDSPLWSVERPEWLKTQFGVTPEQLPQFHAIAEKCGRGWEFIRLTAGVNPSIVPIDTDAKYLTTHTKLDLCLMYKIKEKEYEGELANVRHAWLMWVKQQDKANAKAAEEFTAPPPEKLPRLGRKPGSKKAPPPPPKPPKEHASLPPVELPELPQGEPKPKKSKEYIPPPTVAVPPISDSASGELLSRYGFQDSMFAAANTPEEAVEERNWVLVKIKDYQRLLDEPAVSTMVQHAIVNELLLNRINRQLLATPVVSVRFSDLQETKRQIEVNYQNAWKDINKICPWADQVTNRVNMAGVWSDVIKAIQEYKANKSNARIFGLFSSYGLQIRLREAVQHEPRFRPGQMAALLEAMDPSALWNPNWKRTLTDRQCKLMDETFKEINRRLREENNVPLTDLESDHPTTGEYPPLYTPKEDVSDGLEPNESVPLGE